jgi:hypothetical protein
MQNGKAAAELQVLAELDYPGMKVHGVTWDGASVWFATDGKLVKVDPDTGAIQREIAMEADAGTAFDGRHLWVTGGDRIRKVDPATGEVVSSIPAPAPDASGLAWVDGVLWCGLYRSKKLLKLDPSTGAILKTLDSDRLVTGVSFMEGALWHGAVPDGGGRSELRRVDPESGAIEERLRMPEGAFVSGLEAGDRGRVFCGDPVAHKLRVVRRRG